MKIYAGADGWYDEKGNRYTTDQVKTLYEKQKAKDDKGSLFGNLFSGNTVSYEQTGALDNAIHGYGRGVDVSDVQGLHNSNSYLETDSDKAARLREASSILGFDDGKENLLMQTGMNNDDIMKSALALAKKKQSEPDDWEQFAADHPATVKYLEQQKNMAISYDDVKPLGRLEETANTVKAHLEMMDVEQKIAELGRKYDSLNMSYNELSADQRVELNDLITKRQELQKNIDPWSVGNVLGGLISMKEDLPMALAVGAQTALLAGIGGAAVGGVGAVPAAITGFGAGFKVGMGASMGYRTAGVQYAENMMHADANGQYMDANSLRQGAWAAGLGMGVLGAVGTGRLTGKLPMGQVYDKFLRTTSPSVLNNPAARETAWRGYLSTLGVGLKEAAVQDVIFGGGGSALTYGSNRYSEALSGLDYSNREDGTLLQNIAAGMEQFAPMALGTGVGFSVGGRMMGNALGGKKGPMPVADGLNKVINALDETKTAQRSPQAARDMINTVFGDTASASDVSVDARGLVRLYQEADPDNPNRVYEVAEKLGVDAKTLDEAVATGGDVRVSVKDFALEFSSKGDSSNMRAEVLKEVRDIDGVTENERGEIYAAEEKKFNEVKEDISSRMADDFDKDSDAYKESVRIAREFDPKAKDRDVEKFAKYLTAYAEVAESRGLLQANGITSAADALRMIKTQYSEQAPVDSEGLGQAISPRNQLKADMDQWAGSIKEFLSQDKSDNSPIRVMDTPLALTTAGIKRLPVEIDRKIMRKVLQGKHANEISPDILKKLPERLADPLMILRAIDKNGVEDEGKRIVVVDLKDSNDATVIVPFVLETKGNVNKIASVYGKGTPKPNNQWIVDRMNDKNLLYINKKRADHWLQDVTRAPNGSLAISSLNLSNSIPTERELVNLKIENPAYYQGEGTRLASWSPSVTKDADSRLVPVEMGRAIIEGYKGSNYASLAHEMTHHFTWLMENAVKNADAPESVKRDFETLREFVGGEEGKGFTQEQYEKIADAFETYSLEGKAPSLRLRGVFDRLKQWMKRLYRKFQMDGVEINDDVRGVFDRMLASDAELALAEDFYASEPLFAGREMNETALREYAKLVISAHQEAQKEMDKRVMAEVNPAMKEVRDAAEKTIREDIAAQMQNEPVYAARMLFTAPLDTADFKAARDKAIKAKIDERVDLLVKESAQGIDKRGEVVSEHGTVTENWFVGDSMNHDWYREMFKRRGGKIPASWYNFIKAYKAGEKPLSKMPKSMREEYEHIAEVQLTKGHKDSFLGDIPEDAEFVNLKEGNPAMSWIVENGGGIRLDRASVYERYGKGALPERWLTDKNGYTLDDVADFVYDGKAGGDRLFEELTTKPTFSKELNKRVRAGMAEFKDNEYGTLRESAIKAVHNEKSLEAVAVELEIFEQMAAEMKAKNEQKTADAIAEGRKKAKVENKINEAKDAAAKKAAREQRMVDAAVARGTLRAKAAREMAKNQIADTAVGEIESWQKYAALGNRANKEAIRLMSKGDVEGAIEAKNREILCKALALEAGKADTEVKKMMRFFKRVNKRGLKMNKVPHEFNVQIDNLLAKYNLLGREPLKPLEGDTAPHLSQFIESCKENYFVPDVAENVVNGNPMHYTRLTLNELNDVKQGVQSLQHVGKIMDAVMTGDKKKSISETCEALVNQLSTHEKKYAMQGEMGESKRSFFTVDSLVKAETVLRLMDKGEENGVFVRSLYNPIKLGLDDYANRSRKIVTDWDKLLADTGWTKDELYKQKGVEHTFDFMPEPKQTHERVILTALNWGNEGNRDRARYYFLTPEQRRRQASLSPEEIAAADNKAMQMFEVLTEKDLKLIQGVWDMLETYAPEIRKHEVECAGVDVKMVEPSAFTVMSADGKAVQMRGGYFPIRYDSNKSVRALNMDEANALYKQNSAVAASTSHGHVKVRTAHNNKPLLLEWNTLLDHLRNVNYDLAMRQPIMDVSRILRNGDVESAIAETFGNDTVKSLQDWVRDIATDQRDGKLTFAENVMRWSRTRMSVAYLGFRTKALLIDLPQNFLTSAWQHGLDETVKGISQFYLNGDYRQQMDFVNSRSPMMRDKISFMDANLADLRTSMLDQSISGKYTRFIQKFAFCCDLAADMAINVPMWLRFHSEAVKRGLDDAAANLEADAKVRRMSVDTSKAGMAAIQRGGEGRKLITPFYSYFNAFFNRLYYDYKLSQIKMADGQQMDAARLLVRTAVLGVVLPTTIEAIMQGVVLNNDKEKDPEKRKKNMAKEAASSSFSYIANTVPVVGGMATYGFNKLIGKQYTNYDLSPIESAVESTFGVGGAVIDYVQKKDIDPKAGKKLAESVSRAAALSAPYPNMMNNLAFNIWDIISKGDISLADLVTKRRNQK